MCGECKAQKASYLCLCQYPWKTVCQTCSQPHLSQSSTSEHHLEPLAARDFLITEQSLPSYLDRQTVVTELLTCIRDNEAEVDLCMDYFEQFVTNIQEKVDNWANDTKDKLSGVKEKMRKQVGEMCELLQSIRYKASFSLDTELSRLVHTTSKSQLSSLRPKLRMFSFQFKPYLLTSILSDTFSFTEDYSPFRPSPRIAHFAGDSRKCVDFCLADKAKTEREITGLETSSGASWCLVPDLNEFLYCGGQKDGIVTGETFVVDTVRKTADRKEAMTQPRYAHAIAYSDDCVFVFGGCRSVPKTHQRKVLKRCSLIDSTPAETLTHCESYSLKYHKWERISDLLESRYGASACPRNGSIYIVGGIKSRKAEVYLVPENVFRPLSFELPNDDKFTTVLALSESLLILHDKGLYEWGLKGDGPLVHRGELQETGNWFSPLQAYTYEGVYYFLRGNYEMWGVTEDTKDVRLAFPVA